ncbi:MAG: tetratricopeptide repeat protein [bacterium]
MKKNIFYILIVSFLMTKAVFANGKAEQIKISDDRIIKQQAVIFYDNSNYQRALDYFMSLNDKNLTDDVLLLISNCFDSLGDEENAVAYLKKAVMINNKNPNLYYNLGVLYFNKDNYRLALLFFKQAVSINNKFSQADYNLANCYFNLNDYKNATKYYKKTILNDPKNLDAYYNISVSYGLIGKKKESKQYNDSYNQLKKVLEVKN